MHCKICGNNLFQKITFSNIFKFNYEAHRNCIHNLNFNMDEEVIPIDTNIIIYDYVFSDLVEGFNEEYIWSKYMSKLFVKHLENRKWSIVLFLDENIDYFMRSYNPYLLINLANNPILLISLRKIETFFLEGI